MAIKRRNEKSSSNETLPKLFGVRDLSITQPRRAKNVVGKKTIAETKFEEKFALPK